MCWLVKNDHYWCSAEHCLFVFPMAIATTSKLRSFPSSRDFQSHYTMPDYQVADITLADFGRREIALAEYEMPALMAIRRKYADQKPLQGARIIGCIHMTIQTAVLIRTLRELGADVRWSSCNIFSTQDHAAAAMAADGVPVFAWKGETEEEYEWCIEQTILADGKPWNANAILDDGGDLTQMVHDRYPDMLRSIHGISEETTTGVHRLKEMLENNTLHVPAVDVNASVTKSKNDNRYGCRHSLNDAIKRATDVLLAGKHALVIGYGDVGKGSSASLRQEGMIVRVVEVDPICAMQACMDGYEVVSPYVNGMNTGNIEDIDKRLLGETDLVVTCTGNTNVCDAAMLSSLKSGAIVCNIGHFDNEIDTAYMRENWEWQPVKDQVDQVYRSRDSGDFILLLSKGRLVNLGNAMGHPSRVMDGSFANQVLAQMHIFEQRWADQPPKQRAPVSVEVLPRKLDEEVAQLMVEGLGGTITRLTNRQADYINVDVDGPYKPNDYRY